MGNIPKLQEGDMPEPKSLRKLIGPSFILLGLGLGSGELILWPYLSSHYGLGIIWAAVVGITFQFFLNMEISRYTLVNGESIFVGFARKYGRIAPCWFILSTLIPWMWPGIIASSSSLYSSVFGIPYSPVLACILLVLIGIILSLGKVIYKTQERFQKSIIIVGVPFVFILSLFFAEPTDYADLFSGLIGRGKGYWLLPAGINFATLLGALAYAGAGGNLNLSQSYYVKEKGYGMGKFATRITGLINEKKEQQKLEGTTFRENTENIGRFKVWWKRINMEHLIVFWGTGALTMIILSLLAYTTVYGVPGTPEGLDFIINEGVAIGTTTFPFLGTAFIITAATMLFGTQFSVFASTSRIMSENLVLLDSDRFKINKLSHYFYLFLWMQIFSAIIILAIGFTQPLTLVIISAVLNAITMFIYSILLLKLNVSQLPSSAKPSIIRRIILILALLFYGGFSLFTILEYF